MYSINEAADRLDVSYSHVYGICREYALGGNSKHKRLDERDIDFIEEKIQSKSKRNKEAIAEIRDMLYAVIRSQKDFEKKIMEVLHGQS